MPAKTMELMGLTRAYLAAIESGQVQIDGLPPAQLQKVKEGFHQALTELSAVAAIACNGNSCPTGMQCVLGRCVPVPL